MVSSSCSTMVRPTHYSGGLRSTTTDATLQQKAPYSPSPFPLPRSPACSTRVPPASRRHWSHMAWFSTMLCPARLHGRRVGANLPGGSSLWRRPSFSWSPAAAPLWFVQRTTPAGTAQLRLMPHYGRRHLIPHPHLPGHGFDVLLKDGLIQQGEDLL